jgi:hypothetical protein
MARIAVENNLANVKQFLQNNGFEVVSLDAQNMPDCDCYVISGMDQNMMGMQDIQTGAPVINAHGMSAEQVLAAINARIGQA